MNSFKRKLTNDTNFNTPPFSLVNIFNSLVGIGCIPVPLIRGRVGGRGLELDPISSSIPKTCLSFTYLSPPFFLLKSLSHSSLLFGPTMNSYGLSLRGGLYGYVVQTQFSPLWAAIIPRRRRYVPDHLVDSVSSIFHSWKQYRILDADQKRCCYIMVDSVQRLHNKTALALSGESLKTKRVI